MSLEVKNIGLWYLSYVNFVVMVVNKIASIALIHIKKSYGYGVNSINIELLIVVPYISYMGK